MAAVVQAGLAALLCGLATPSAAQPRSLPQVAPTSPAAEPSQGSFTFRSVRPPRPGTKKLLSNQFLGFSGTPKDSTDWFWRGDGGAPRIAPGRRLGPILATHAARFGRPARVEADQAAARAMMAAHGEAFRRAAETSGLNLPLLLAVAATESGGRADAVSPKGAQGLMQLMPATAADLGGADPFDPEEAVPAAAVHLASLLTRFGDDPLSALAAYNAGAEAVRRHHGAPPYAETRAYVPRVLAAYQAIRALCLPPPEEARDACAASPALAR